MEWTSTTISRVRALWAEGLSTAEIGRRLGITKNAVIGKAHRLGLPPRPSPMRHARSGRAPRRRLPAVGPGVRATQPQPQPPPRPAPVIEPLRRHRAEPCRAPFGTPGQPDFRFCEEPTSGRYRAPYCDACAPLLVRTVRVEVASAA